MFNEQKNELNVIKSNLYIHRPNLLKHNILRYNRPSEYDL